MHFRKSRMRRFVKIIKPFEGMKVLDLGVQPDIWDFVETPLNITCQNLPGIAMVDYETQHNIKLNILKVTHAICHTSNPEISI